MARCMDGVVFAIHGVLFHTWSNFSDILHSIGHRKPYWSFRQIAWTTRSACRDELLGVDTILAVINRVQDLLVNDQIQLHKHLCRYLVKKLAKTKIVLEDQNRSTSLLAGYSHEQGALREILVLLELFEDLVRKCMCQNILDGAITLANIDEEVAEFRLDLSWWTSMVKFAALHGCSNMQGQAAKGKEAQEAAAKAVQKHQTLVKKLLKETGSKTMQRALEEDKKCLLHKLNVITKKHEAANSSSIVGPINTEYALAVYSLYKCQGDGDVPVEVALQLMELTKVKTILRLRRGGQGHEVIWLNRKCSLKVFEATDVKESLILCRCNHPHIVKYFLYCEDDDTRSSCHLLMEWMPKNLTTHIDDEFDKRRRCPIDLEVAIDLMLQIAKGMRYLHNRKIAHRDLKPSSILVQTSETSLHQDGYVRVKLADFGIVAASTWKSVYSAPEVDHEAGAKNVEFSLMTDIWSFGMICSQIITGKVPYEDDCREGLRAKIVEGLRPDLPAQHCPEYLRILICRCWDIHPGKRPTFVEICKMLKLSKAVSVGGMHFDGCKQLFSSDPRQFSELITLPTARQRDAIASVASQSCPTPRYAEMQCRQSIYDSGQKYILIGTSFRFYTNASKREEICEQYDTYSTGIKADRFKNKCAVDEMSPFEIVIMEGSCWTQPAETFAYGCLTGVFVNSQHVKKLEESNIKWVAGGFLGETDTRSIAPQIEKFAWGTAESSSFSTENYVTVGSFYSKGNGGSRYVYVHMSYSLTEQAVISHVWHGEDLVVGDPSTENMSSRNVKVVASQILKSFYGEKLTTFSISFSSTYTAALLDISPTCS